ncbi:MAG: efflux RND transporter periplasmic adaptor subunit [Magnetospirillum sp. WYHS-4]
MTIPARLLAAGLLLAAGVVQAAEYEIATVATQKVGRAVTVGGTVVPYKEVTLSAQIPGEVTFLAGTEGDEFTSGASLVSIDDAALQAQKRAALANIYNADAALRNAQVQYSRELYSPQSNNVGRMPGMGMPSMFDTMFTRGMSNMMGMGNSYVDRSADLYGQVSGVNRARSSLLQAQAEVETIDAKLKDARLHAPFDGVVLKKMVEVGDTVQPGQPLLRFAHTKYLRIQAEVPVRLVGALSKGAMVPARLDVRGARVDARISQIFPMADASRHTVTVKFDLPVGVVGGPGMYAEVQITDPGAEMREEPVIPEAALVWRGSLPGVFLSEDGKIVMRLVRLGVPMGDGRISILSGLKGGERVIVNPPAGLASSSAIKIEK